MEMFFHTIRLIASFVACHWQQSNGIIIKSYSLFRPLILPRRRAPPAPHSSSPPRLHPPNVEEAEGLEVLLIADFSDSSKLPHQDQHQAAAAWMAWILVLLVPLLPVIQVCSVIKETHLLFRPSHFMFDGSFAWKKALAKSGNPKLVETPSGNDTSSSIIRSLATGALWGPSSLACQGEWQVNPWVKCRWGSGKY